MRKRIKVMALCFATLAMSAAAQTAVTTTGGTANAVAKFSGNSTVVNSAITESGGKVGIGTTSPGSLLDVEAPAATDRIIAGGNTSSYTGADIRIKRSSAAASPGQAPDLELDDTGDGVSAILQVSSGGLQFYTYSSQWAERMRLTPVGNVGIGTASPGAKLEVDGDVKLTSGSGAAVVFPDGTVQTTAYTAPPPGSGTPALQVESNDVVVNEGVSANGSGLKHVRTNASCQVGGEIGDTCNIAVTWPGTPFTDANYTATCDVKSISGNGTGGASYGFTLQIKDANKGTGSMTVVVLNLNNGGPLTVNGLNCIAIHD